MTIFSDGPLLIGIVLTPPPTRAETIKEAWRHVSDRFDFERGKLVATHHAIEPITFELKDYGDTFAIEAEGVIVQKYPVARK